MNCIGKKNKDHQLDTKYSFHFFFFFILFLFVTISSVHFLSCFMPFVSVNESLKK